MRHITSLYHQVPSQSSRQENFRWYNLAPKLMTSMLPHALHGYMSIRSMARHLSGSHVPAMRPMGLKYRILNQMTVKMDRWIIREGMVLVTCSGTIGRTAVVSCYQDGWAASQHILRIMPTAGKTHPGFLCAFLTTAYGQHQLNSKIYGGVVDKLASEDTQIIWMPDVVCQQKVLRRKDSAGL